MKRQDPKVNAKANLRGFIATTYQLTFSIVFTPVQSAASPEPPKRDQRASREKNRVAKPDSRIGKKRNATPKQATPPAQQAKNPRNLSHLYPISYTVYDSPS